MQSKYLCGIVALALAAPLASAQSDSYFDSTNSFTVNVSDPSVTITQDPNNASGPYQNFSPQTSGDGVNQNVGYGQSFDWATAGSEYAQGESYSAANGMATEFQGIAYNMVFTNTSNMSQTFSLAFDVVQNLVATGYSTTDAYGGWEINGYSTYGYFTNTLHGDGTYSSDYQGGFTGGYNPLTGSYEGTDSVLYTLAAGTSAQVQIWASGDTFAQQPPAVPEPMSMTALGLGVAGLVARRRRK